MLLYTLPLNSKLLFLWLIFYVNVSVYKCLGLEQNVDASTNTTLEFVTILIRHGFRSPEWTYPRDPYRNQKKYWPVGWGQLLPDGEQNIYKRGKIFRERYKDFISSYRADAMTVFASDYDRCHASAALLLAGWFPPDDHQKWNKKLNWQPIAIHSEIRSRDKMLAQEAPCPRYELEMSQLDAEIKSNETEADKELYKYLTKHMGEPITNIHQLETYYLTLKIEEQVGYTLPKWTKKVYPHQIKEKAFLSLLSHSWTKFMHKIVGGPMVKEVLNTFQLKSEGHIKDQKLVIYAAHDTTICNLMQALQVKVTEWPGYGTAFIFELHRSQDDRFFVKMLYTNGTLKKEPVELDVLNCGRPCSLKKLFSVTEYLRSVDWDKDCML